VPITEANRQGIVDPLTAMFFSAAAAGEGLSPEACRQTLPIFDGLHRYVGRKRIRGAGGGVFRRLRTNSRPSPAAPPCQIPFRSSTNGGYARTGRQPSAAGAASGIAL